MVQSVGVTECGESLEVPLQNHASFLRTAITGKSSGFLDFNVPAENIFEEKLLDHGESLEEETASTPKQHNMPKISFDQDSSKTQTSKSPEEAMKTDRKVSLQKVHSTENSGISDTDILIHDCGNPLPDELQKTRFEKTGNNDFQGATGVEFLSPIPTSALVTAFPSILPPQTTFKSFEERPLPDVPTDHEGQQNPAKSPSNIVIINSLDQPHYDSPEDLDVSQILLELAFSESPKNSEGNHRTHRFHAAPYVESSSQNQCAVDRDDPCESSMPLESPSLGEQLSPHSKQLRSSLRPKPENTHPSSDTVQSGFAPHKRPRQAKTRSTLRIPKARKLHTSSYSDKYWRDIPQRHARKKIRSGSSTSRSKDDAETAGGMEPSNRIPKNLGKSASNFKSAFKEKPSDPSRRGISQKSSLQNRNTELVRGKFDKVSNTFKVKMNSGLFEKYILSIPGHLYPHICRYFKTLYEDISKINASQTNTKGLINEKQIKVVIKRAYLRVAMEFLASLMVLQKGFQTPGTCLIEDGWKFISTHLNQWSTLDAEKAFKPNKEPINRYLDCTEHTRIFRYLFHLKRRCIVCPSVIWSLWLKWYRQSTYPNKRPVLGANHFVHEIKILKENSENILETDINHSNRVTRSWNGLAQLKFLHLGTWIGGLHPKKYREIHKGNKIERKYLISFVREAGTIELHVLHLKENVEEMFEGISTALKRNAELLGYQESEPKLYTEISKVARRACWILSAVFLGSISILHPSKPPSQDYVVNPLVYHGWEFMKKNLENFKNPEVLRKSLQSQTKQFPEISDPDISSFLLSQLLELKSSGYMSPSFLWELWKVWYKHSGQSEISNTISVPQYPLYEHFIKMLQEKYCKLRDDALASNLAMEMPSTSHTSKKSPPKKKVKII
ncbi:hypothetical protein CROQUDRAFT_708901 [Cronartium quercuum f. sp. fusiforme G11]|uniref:Uncharacterized protein n=1 Tax=Cronartium quercuum f. sp. fusiforme G11 TaxID=708437 RepID=A0A9P6NJ62_9BASI|nr:hypothetical protein CROQUDRAFT_708901 [Cronartium quercuum f. sp. fusiforme G11]